MSFFTVLMRMALSPKGRVVIITLIALAAAWLAVKAHDKRVIREAETALKLKHAQEREVARRANQEAAELLKTKLDQIKDEADALPATPVSGTQLDRLCKSDPACRG